VGARPMASTADQILTYLSEHPQAQDTMEGIIHWWLLQVRIERASADVRAALNALTAQRLILVRAGSDGRQHFRVNPQAIRQVRQRLRKNPASPCQSITLLQKEIPSCPSK